MTRKATFHHIYLAMAPVLVVAAFLGIGLTPCAVAEGEAEAEVAATPARPSVSMVGYSGEAANYWPRWRGPNGDGTVSGDYDYPHQWSAQENVLWKVDVPGADSASPIVWGDKIFLVTADTTGDARTRSILGFSATDGKLLFTTAAPDPDQMPTRRRTDRSIATPATDGERVYAHLGAHGLMAVDFEGKEVWQRTLGTFDHATSSPLLIDDYIVVVQVLSRRAGSGVYAYDKTTGYLKWHARRDEMFASGSPIAIQVGDRKQVVVSAQQYVRSYDPLSGKQIWEVLGTEQNAIPTPVVGFGMVYVTSGPRGKTFAIHPTGTGNVTRTHTAWQAKETGPTVPSPLFHDGYLFVASDTMGTLTCFDGGTGEVVWSEKILDTRSGGLTASPVLVDGKIFITDESGSTHVFAAGPQFDFQGTNRLGEPVHASPALSEGVWYFRTKRHLIAIGTP